MSLLGQFQNQLKFKLITKKPLFLIRAGQHYFKNLLHLPPTLRTLDVMINTECTCRCEHCFAESFAQDQSHRSKLTLKEFQDALREASDNGVFHFSLQGGEPFLHPNLNELILACQPHKSYITIVSNGTVATLERLAEVYRLGADKVAISLDSNFSEEHDNFRRLQGCFNKAINTLQLARSVGLETAIATTITNETLHKPSIQNLLTYALKNKINVEINIPQPIGNWDGRTDLTISEANSKYLEKLHKKNNSIRRDLYFHLGRRGCPAVKEALYLNVYGDIFPCVFMHIGIGNVREHNLKDIRANALSVKEFAHYAPKCLASEDLEFVKKYISQGFGKVKPADGFKIFNLKKLSKRK